MGRVRVTSKILFCALVLVYIVDHIKTNEQTNKCEESLNGGCNDTNIQKYAEFFGYPSTNVSPPETKSNIEKRSTDEDAFRLYKLVQFMMEKDKMREKQAQKSKISTSTKPKKPAKNGSRNRAYGHKPIQKPIRDNGTWFHLNQTNSKRVLPGKKKIPLKYKTKTMVTQQTIEEETTTEGLDWNPFPFPLGGQTYPHPPVVDHIHNIWGESIPVTFPEPSTTTPDPGLDEYGTAYQYPPPPYHSYIVNITKDEGPNEVIKYNLLPFFVNFPNVTPTAYFVKTTTPGYSIDEIRSLIAKYGEENYTLYMTTPPTTQNYNWLFLPKEKVSKNDIAPLYSAKDHNIWRASKLPKPVKPTPYYKGKPLPVRTYIDVGPQLRDKLIPQVTQYAEWIPRLRKIIWNSPFDWPYYRNLINNYDNSTTLPPPTTTTIFVPDNCHYGFDNDDQMFNGTL